MNLHPEYPVVESTFQITTNWSITLPAKFNRRMEDGNLVLWKPGLTIYLAVWGNDHSLSKAELIDDLKHDSSEFAYDFKDTKNGFSYRLNENADDDRMPALYCYAVDACGFVQMAAYFDHDDDLLVAETIHLSLIASKS